MLTIDASSGKKPLDVVLKEHDLVLCREIIHCVCDAMDMGLSQIVIAIIKVPDGYPDIFINTSECEYKQCLQKNMRALIAAEEYELCAKAIEYIERIDQLVEI